ncbi:hypothetical protein C0431_12455 [bacterium]|nr:hypothetical protein [bacterium]
MSRMLIVCILGASGSGKSSIARELMKRKIPSLVSHRTRPIREKEEHGVDGYFVTRERFLEYAAQGTFCATTEYHGNLYGLSLGELSHFKAMGKEAVSYVVDVNGLVELREGLKDSDEYDVIAIGLCSPSTSLKERMLYRGDDPEKIEGRMAGHKEESKSVFSEADYVIGNADGKIQLAVRDILEIIKREKDI